MNTDLINYTLQLADNALILGHRNSEWCGHGPILEQDIAISNISLDLIGQARNFYQYAALLKGDNFTEDSFAYFRDSPAFKNVLLAEQPKGDWAETILRQFLFSSCQYFLFEKLREGKDEQIAAIAVKSLKEITYHLRWSSEWVIRLGDGTEESHSRMMKAIDALWNYTDELFIPAEYELQLANQKIIPDVTLLKGSWLQMVKEVFGEATLSIPASSKTYKGGKDGKHSEHLDALLKELQSVARAHPAASW
ncbi:MAG TPA: 1,2-phenylacetyl-CoA epoxidase subunit PaaC [Chitinophagaceae bacterium]|nr:1,2-phenylacetyl-CoA epoxidase subunit PaaC [Chitinophagaceae bacterium]